MKNLKKIFFSLTAIIVSVLAITGCAKTSEQKDEPTTEASQGNCKVLDCIKQLEVKNTVEEINEVMGFEGKKSDYSEDVTWKINSKEWITLTHAGDSPILQANFDKEQVKNDKTDFSTFSDISADLKKGKVINYEDMKKRVGGVEGVLVGKTSSSHSYAWVDKNNRVLRATFKTGKKGACSIVSLR